MSTTTTSFQGSSEIIEQIELESLGYPLPSLQRPHNQNKTTPLPEPANESSESLTLEHSTSISKLRATIVIGTVACISLINAMLGGILIVSLPTMARDLDLADSLLLWPAGVSSLACGCTLLLSGSVADVIGGRTIYFIGEFGLVVTTVACGVCRTGIELILSRAAQGVALSLCLPSSVSLITRRIPTGSYRNTAFAVLGAGQPVGFSVGLVLGGVFVDSVGWRYGYYIGAILTFVISIVSLFSIPSDPSSGEQSLAAMLQRMKAEIDWIGCTLLSTSLGLFSYVFAILASGASSFLNPIPIVFLCVAIALLPLFGFHVKRQERLNKPAIIPLSILGNRAFTTLCISVFLIWGSFNSVQFFLTLFFQSIQSLSAIQTSLRFLPMVVTGASTNILTGWLVKHVRADHLVLYSSAITAVSPLLLAIAKPEWNYWTCAFFAVAFCPVAADVLFTVANLLITSVFPPHMHGLAGGVFNTISMIGNSVGLAVTAVVASAVTMKEIPGGKSGKEEEMDGYRATFWSCFGVDVLILAVVGMGLRRIGKVGIKTD